MLRQTKAFLYTGLAILFGWTGYLVLRVDCIYLFTIRPCDPLAGMIGLVFWIIALVMVVLAKKVGSSDRKDGE